MRTNTFTSSLLSLWLTSLLSASPYLWPPVRFLRVDATWSVSCLLCSIISLSCCHFIYAISAPSSILLSPRFSQVTCLDLISNSTGNGRDFPPMHLIRANNTININSVCPVTTSCCIYYLEKHRIYYWTITNTTSNHRFNSLNANFVRPIPENVFFTMPIPITTIKNVQRNVTISPIKVSSYIKSMKVGINKFLNTVISFTSDNGVPSEIFNQPITILRAKRAKNTTKDIFSHNGSLLSLEHNGTFYQECLLNRKSVIRLITIIMYSMVCIVGLCGNSLVIYVVLRYSKMQTVTNIYILNLAIADECFLIGLPFLLYTMNICSWHFGEYMCKFYMISTSITQFTSSIFLLIMAADRYIAVCHPIKSQKYRTINIAKLVSVLAWFVSAILMLPVVLFARSIQHDDDINVFSCNIDWPKDYQKHTGTTFTLYTFILGFAIPLTFILIFYVLVIRKLHLVHQKHSSKDRKRSHRKVTRLVLTVIAVYVLCWLPHWTSQVSLIIPFTGQRELSRFEILMFLLFGCLAYSNSAINPILYAFLSDNFRKSFSKAFTCIRQQDVNGQLLNEPSIFTQKRTSGILRSRFHQETTSKRLRVLKRLTVTPIESPNHSLLLMSASRTTAQVGVISSSDLSRTSAASDSTVTTINEKLSHSVHNKTTNTTELNKNLVGKDQ